MVSFIIESNEFDGAGSEELVEDSDDDAPSTSKFLYSSLIKVCYCSFFQYI